MNSHLKYYLKSIGQLLNTVVDIFLPKSKTVLYLENLNPAGIFTHIPRAENFDFPVMAKPEVGLAVRHLKAMFNYKHRLCRQAIWEIKYRANPKLIADFSLLLYEFILEELNDLEDFENFTQPVLIPIPASTKRNREKGFNQCVLICRELIKLDRERGQNTFTLNEKLLIKTTETTHQARAKNKQERLQNLKGTFSVRETNQINLSKHSFIIIDDVITTGATMNEAFHTLKKAGVKKLRGFALAH